MLPVAMTIAGSDPSGGAGLQADLKTFHQHGVYGTSVVTLLTVQNTQSVSAVEMLPSGFVTAQLDAVLHDIPPSAIKTGALGNAETIRAVAQAVSSLSCPLVVDPVMVSKHGDLLMDEAAIEVLVHELLPLAFLVTPNRYEAARLAKMEVDSVAAMMEAATAIARLGPRHTLLKGGSLPDGAVDLLWSNGKSRIVAADVVDTHHTHGSGCVYGAAITARLAHGEDLQSAVRSAKQFITRAIQSHPGLGRGRGPVDMHQAVDTRGDTE